MSPFVVALSVFAKDSLAALCHCQNTRRSMQVTRITPAHVEDFRRIRLTAFKRAPDAFGRVFEVESMNPLESFAQKIDGSHVFGAWAEDRLVGLIGLTQETGVKERHKAFLWGFYVEPECRGQGAGKALVTAALDTARPLVEQVHLSVVSDCVAAMTLYKQCGFEVYGTALRSMKTTHGYVDELLMVYWFQK